MRPSPGPQGIPRRCLHDHLRLRRLTASAQLRSLLRGGRGAQLRRGGRLSLRSEVNLQGIQADLSRILGHHPLM